MGETDIKQAIQRVLEAARAGRPELDDGDIAALMEAAVLLYARKAMAGEAEDDTPADRMPPPLPPQSSVGATEVLILVTGLLEAVNLNVFELGMWQHIGRFRPVNPE